VPRSRPSRVAQYQSDQAVIVPASHQRGRHEMVPFERCPFGKFRVLHTTTRVEVLCLTSLCHPFRQWTLKSSVYLPSHELNPPMASLNQLPLFDFSPTGCFHRMRGNEWTTTQAISGLKHGHYLSRQMVFTSLPTTCHGARNRPHPLNHISVGDLRNSCRLSVQTVLSSRKHRPRPFLGDRPDQD
jgi:hypothetical protein